MSMDMTNSIIAQTEKTHKNLGLYVVMNKMIDLANMGVLTVGPRGKGKTRAIEALVSIPHRDILIVTNLTPAGLPKFTDKLDNNEVTVLNKDLAGFYTDYLRDVGLNLVSSILTDHEYISSTGRHYINIRNSTISFISCAQHNLMHSLTKIDSWNSMYRDRLLRIYMLYWRKPEPTPERIKIRVDLNPIPIDKVTIPIDIVNKPLYKKIENIIIEQTSPGRGKLYIQNLLKASASLNGRDIVIDKDLEFLSLFIIPMGLEKLLSERLYGPGESLIFNHNAYALLFYVYEQQEADRRDIVDYFKITRKTLKATMDYLMQYGLVKGTYGKPIYRPSPIIEELFTTPVKKYMEVVL